MIDPERWMIMVNKKNLKMSEQFLQFQIMYIISLVEHAYYELIYAKENVKVQETALAFAERLYKDNLAKVKAGALIPRDEKFAESEVAMRKADILEAMHLVKLQESILKNLMVDDLENWKDVRIVPAAPLIAIPQKFDIQESWQLGLSQRPDIMQLKTSVQISDLDIRYYKNQKLPDLSLVGRYGQSAISTGAENMFADSWSPRYPDYMYGVEVVFPWSNREVKAKLRQSKEMREQAELMVKKLEQEVMVQIQDAVSFAKTSYDRIEATRQARIAAEIAVAVEEKKYQNGASTAYLVLEYQNNLVLARLAEIRALVDYNKALTSLAFGEGTILDKLKIKIDFE
jgi:outer membrane protein TolC